MASGRGSSPWWNNAEGPTLGRWPEERGMGSTSKYEESTRWEDLQAVGIAATLPYKSKGDVLPGSF